MLFKSSKRPSPLRHLRRQWHRAAWQAAPAVAGGELPSHHILCAGPYTVPFARLAAEAARQSCPVAWRPQLALHIHVDAVARPLRDKVLAWLAEVPGVNVTYGLFGIAPGDRIPGKWHQTMVNDVVDRFADEAHVAFIDADLFIDGPAWWETVRQRLNAEIYALTVGLRETRTLTVGDRRFAAIKTNLFTLNTAVHRRLNPQRFTKDAGALAVAAGQRVPGGQFEVGRGLDSMVLGSLVAQGCGYRVEDVEAATPHCHVGGFSHIKPEKFVGKGSLEQAEIDTWLCRVRLINRVIEHMRGRDWLGYLDPAHLAIVGETSAVVGQRADLRARLDELPLTAHELAFEHVLAGLVTA